MAVQLNHVQNDTAPASLQHLVPTVKCTIKYKQQAVKLERYCTFFAIDVVQIGHRVLETALTDLAVVAATLAHVVRLDHFDGTDTILERDLGTPSL